MRGGEADFVGKSCSLARGSDARRNIRGSDAPKSIGGSDAGAFAPGTKRRAA